MKNKQEIKLLTRQWQLLCHCSICPMVHTEPELDPFNTGKKHKNLVCWNYRIFFFLFCNNLAFSVSEPWFLQGLHFGGSFHSHPQSCSYPCLGISCPVLPHQPLPHVFRFSPPHSKPCLQTPPTTTQLWVYLQVLLALLQFQVLPCR